MTGKAHLGVVRRVFGACPRSRFLRFECMRNASGTIDRRRSFTEANEQKKTDGERRCHCRICARSGRTENRVKKPNDHRGFRSGNPGVRNRNGPSKAFASLLPSPRNPLTGILQMSATVLLVTWMVFNQPPSSYQVEFSSMQACEAARDYILKDGQLLAAESQRKPAGLAANAIYNPGPPPRVTAICAQK